MDEKMGPDTDVQLWCEEYVKNQTMDKMVNGTLGIHPNPTIWIEMNYIAGLKLFAYVVIITGGLLGNVGVILTVLLNRSMRNTTNYYVVNLAVSDVLICVFCVKGALKTVTQNDIFLLGKFMCTFTDFMTLVCLSSSCLTLIAISCDRSMAILYPFRSRVTKQRSSLVIAFIWIFSIAFSVPNVSRKYVVNKYENFELPRCLNEWSETYQYYAWSDEKCHAYHTPLVIYVAVASVVIFFLPVLVMTTAYSLILWRLWKTKVPGEQIAANVDAHTKAKRKVNKMVFVVLIVFIICWTPEEAAVLNFLARDSTIDARPYDHWLKEFHWFSSFFALSNSFLNPFIYGGFDKSFFDGILTIFRCGLKKKSRSDRFRITITTCVPTQLKEFRKSLTRGPARVHAVSRLTEISQRSTLDS